MQLTSSNFKPGEKIPVKFTCDSSDISPELRFLNIPEGTKSLALICDDPDAPVGTWVHWVIFNIPPDLDGLAEKVPTDKNPRVGSDSSYRAIQGINDFGRFGYGGPCPPRGKAHRYFFKLYALDIAIEFDAKAIEKGISAANLMSGMKGHIIEETSLMGLYGRR
nr:YbhB/YbcL family Raf kinase inhibitor-like protein [candidate division Zixibacteria bacterium]